MRFLRHLTMALVVVGGALGPAGAQGQNFDTQIKALEWRFIGPVVGGRGSSVVGHPTQEHVFFQANVGGLWKTHDAGLYWMPVGDGQFRLGSIGAVAIADSDPQVMYVGTGEPQLRNDVSWGDGVYKSTDGGDTWVHMGLEETHHISRVRIHPENPDRVYVSAMGHAFGPNPERGVFRSNDGGATWEKVLFKSDGAGVIDLIMNPSNSDELFAAVWEFERKTWGAKTGGAESGLWRSLDGGDTWEEISRNAGLPEGRMGRIGLAMSAADARRVYALMDSETKAGLYRSDDLGQTWSFVSDDSNITARPFYFSHLYASPHNADHLWSPANKLWWTMDGGETWVLEPAGKDDFHDFWIDSNNPDRMATIHDGGAQVTLTGGLTWSPFWNQKTVEFYRLNVDDQFPYNLYGTAQDLVAFKVPSQSRWEGISLADTEIVGNGETSSAIPHPDEPEIVYSIASGSPYGPGGAFTKNNLVTGQSETRHVWPEASFGIPATDFRFRVNWLTPFFVSPHDPSTIYLAGNVVFRTTDEGMTWDEISGDLTRNIEENQQVAGTDWMPEYFGQEIYSTIHALAESPVEEGTLWAGSDDGLIHVTRDGGANWSEVTPPGLPEFSDVYEIEPSPHDAGTAYVAISRYLTADDYSPYLFRTDDHGENWTRLSDSFPLDEITRTIREDPGREGLLFVGTETGVFTSIDDGMEWHRLKLNLPAIPVYDMKIKDADLVVSTHGRGFWILDDISPLRQYTEDLATRRAHLFKPADHARLGYNWWIDYTPGGDPGDKKNYFVQNTRPGHTFRELGMEGGVRRREFIDAGDARPPGPLFYYLLSEETQDVSLAILDSEGNEIRTFSAEEIPTERFSVVAIGEYEATAASGLPRPRVSRGLNRFSWDMRYPMVTSVPGRPPTAVRPFAKPGTYQVRLMVDGETQTQSFELHINPNESYTQAETDAKFEFWMTVYEKAEEGTQAVLRGRQAKDRVQAAVEVAEGGDAGTLRALQQLAEAINAGADAFESSMLPTGRTLVQIIAEPSKFLPKLSFMNSILETSEGPPNQGMTDVFEKVSSEMDAEMARFAEERDDFLARLEELTGKP